MVGVSSGQKKLHVRASIGGRGRAATVPTMTSWGCGDARSVRRAAGGELVRTRQGRLMLTAPTPDENNAPVAAGSVDRGVGDTARRVLALQRAVGNRAVASMLAVQRRPGHVPASDAGTATGGGVRST